MKYFTKIMWRELQQRGSKADESHAQWQRAFDDYRINLESLRTRVDDFSYKFFSDADIHDAELLDMRVVDGSRPAPIGTPTRPWENLTPFPVRVEMTILDAQDEHVWRLVYSSIRTLLVDFPSDDPLFNRGGGGFEDLGYHELTDAGDGFLRHELLFSSGAILVFEFQNLAITSTLARTPRAPK